MKVRVKFNSDGFSWYQIGEVWEVTPNGPDWYITTIGKYILASDCYEVSDDTEPVSFYNPYP